MHPGTIRPISAEHVTIYRRPDRFAAWPFNCGVFKYSGDEVIVGFVSKYCTYRKPYEVDHGYQPPEKPSRTFLARSPDGGLTWPDSGMREICETDNLDWRLRHDKDSFPVQTPVDFTNPNLMILQGMAGVDRGGVGYYLISTDRGKTFQGPIRLPWSRYDYVWGRPDYVIREDGACLLLTTVFNDKEDNGRPAIFISRNGGFSWMLFSYIAPLCSDYMRIMPSAVLMPDGEIVATCRCQRNPMTLWSECFASRDGGRTWEFRSRVNDQGAPCHLLLLDDGRILATYGYRHFPFGIRAAVSDDAGKTWGPEIILRDDGGSWDLGYPKSVQLDGGRIFSTYYFNDKSDAVQQDGGVRYIAGTRWEMKAI